MDPDVTLHKMRQQSRMFAEYARQGLIPTAMSYAVQIVDDFERLDEHLIAGGVPPQPWGPLPTGDAIADPRPD